MFIGQQDESSINFARPKGAKDKMPRKKKGMGVPSASQAKENLRKNFAGNMAKGLAGAAVIGAAARYGRSGKAQMGLNRALKGSAMSAREKVDSFRQGAVNAVRSDVGSARQKVGGKLDSIGQGMERRGGYDQVHARTSGGSFEQKLDGVRAGEKMASRGSALRKTAARIRGNR